MLLLSIIPPESTTSGSPLEIFRPLDVTPDDTVMVIARSFFSLTGGARSVDAVQQRFDLCNHILIAG
jgi:hypothetical protein